MSELKLREAKLRPPITCIYGSEGIGKTTFGTEAPNPVFILTEDGLADPNVPAFEVATSLHDVSSSLSLLFKTEHDYKTVVIDSLDWLERLIHKQVCIDNDVKSIEDLGWGKGYKDALEYWGKLIDGLAKLRNKKNMIIILIAHSAVRTVSDPLTESYDKFEIKLQKSATALVSEFCDIILFATQEIHITQEDKGFGNKRKRAISDGERVMYCRGLPTFTAKTRSGYNLPPQLPLNWQAFMSAIKGES